MVISVLITNDAQLPKNTFFFVIIDDALPPLKNTFAIPNLNVVAHYFAFAWEMLSIDGSKGKAIFQLAATLYHIFEFHII